MGIFLDVHKAFDSKSWNITEKIMPDRWNTK